MVKIVYNACFGGFGISEKAVRLGREISGDPKWGGPIPGEYYSDGSGPACAWMDSFGSELERTDPVLVEVVERLGDEANGAFASLGIVSLPAGTKYRIDEYDGAESVQTPDSYNWDTA